MKWKILIILTLILIIPNALALDVCEDKPYPSKECLMFTPVLNCSVYDYEIINSSGTMMTEGNLTLLNNSIYYLTFNQSVGGYIVKLCDDSTREVNVKGGDNMFIAFMLGIFIFSWIILKVAVNLDKEHTLLKALFFIISIIMAFSGLAFGLSFINYFFTDGVILSSATTIYKISLWTFRLFAGYLIVYYIYKALKWLSEVIKK